LLLPAPQTGRLSSEQNPSHTYSSPGNYTVQLTVKNDTCEHSTTKQILVIVEEADFIASDTVVCKNVPVDFHTRNILPNNIAAYQWNFGDGVTQNGGNAVSHSYSAAGNYDVRLTITDVNGCRDTLVRPVYIHVDGPTAEFNSQIPGACLLQNIVFVDSSASDGLHPIASWIWNYGDGSVDTLHSPPFQHAYAAAGRYNVVLKVVDSKGCTDSIAKRNSLFISNPKANFISPDTNSCTKHYTIQ
jgi:PKD repeat protein